MTRAGEKIFISYARSDEAMVLKIAAHLRNLGANVWLDQLRIQPGSIWDTEVEEAIKTSKCLIFITSKASVKSQIALDEVYYAMGLPIRVIPLIIEQCEIPLRLKRLQRIDLIGNYNHGMHALETTLGLLAPGSEPQTGNNPITIKKKKRLLIIAASLLTLAFIAWIIQNNTNRSGKKDIDTIPQVKTWLVADSIGNMDSLPYYIKEKIPKAELTKIVSIDTMSDKTERYYLVHYLSGWKERLIILQTSIADKGLKPYYAIYCESRSGKLDCNIQPIRTNNSIVFGCPCENSSRMAQQLAKLDTVVNPKIGNAPEGRRYIVDCYGPGNCHEVFTFGSDKPGYFSCSSPNCRMRIIEIKEDK